MCWHKKLLATVWTPISYATFHSRDRVCIESWILEKVLKLICPAFSRPGKSLENRDQYGKKVKSLEFFFQSYKQLALYVFFFLVQSYSVSPVCFQCIMKKALFLRCLGLFWSPILITLSLEKKNSEKVLNFGSKNLYEPCGEQQCVAASLLCRDHHSYVWTRLRVVAKRECAWKSPHARKGNTWRGERKMCVRVAFSRVGWFSHALAFCSLYYPWGKMGDYS